MVLLRLLAFSATTIARVLNPIQANASHGKQRHNAHSSAARRSVPVHTFADWTHPAPVYAEADLVAHNKSLASGTFVQTLTLTDVATG
jgi:hypothetical protein